MNKIWVVACREFLETVKTRTFFLGVILMPALIVLLIFGSNYIQQMAEEAATPLRTIAVIDHDRDAMASLQEQVEAHNGKNPGQPLALVAGEEPEDSLNDAVRTKRYYAYVVIPDDAVTGDGKPRIGRGDDQLAAGQMLAGLVKDAIVNARYSLSDPPIDRERVRNLERPVSIETIDINTGKLIVDETMSRILTPFIFIFLLYMGTFGISMGLLTSVLEEKSTRIVEVLLSAISPMQLMAGKILGVSMVGVVVLGIWSSVGYFTARSQHMEHLITGSRLLWVALYFVPAFLFMSSLLAGIGSACNTLKEAQSMVSPLSILNILPLALWMPISQYPNTALSVGLSFVPPITPFIMILRLCADPNIPLWQIIATLALLWASVIAAIWAAGKVFRVGVLMYGKPPSIRELFRWIRYA
ncbi:MAG: ABC transporter permease [Planctomycetota bacterium]